MKKNYVGIIRDHSGSMAGLSRQAAQDYNACIQGIKSNAALAKLDTIVSVAECGGGVKVPIFNSSIVALREIDPSDYKTPGMNTPLFDSVGKLIEIFEATPDKDRDDVSFMVMAITDGQENASSVWSAERLRAKVEQLQHSDRWTFVFRVPKGYSQTLARWGIPEHNILEWEQTKQGFETATRVTSKAFGTYYSNLSRGVKSTKKFFVNIDDKTIKRDLKNLTDISQECTIIEINKRSNIKDFVTKKFGQYVLGSSFYSLNKTEKVQPQKQLAIRDKKTGKIFAGAEARDALNLPHGDHIKVTPGYHGNYDIFVQSTSVNRILVPGQQLLYRPTH